MTSQPDAEHRRPDREGRGSQLRRRGERRRERLGVRLRRQDRAALGLRLGRHVGPEAQGLRQLGLLLRHQQAQHPRLVRRRQVDRVPLPAQHPRLGDDPGRGQLHQLDQRRFASIRARASALRATLDLRYPADPSDPLFGVDPDIKPFQQEEYQIGADYQLTTTSILGAPLRQQERDARDRGHGLLLLLQPRRNASRATTSATRARASVARIRRARSRRSRRRSATTRRSS